MTLVHEIHTTHAFLLRTSGSAFSKTCWEVVCLQPKAAETDMIVVSRLLESVGLFLGTL